MAKSPPPLWQQDLPETNAMLRSAVEAGLAALSLPRARVFFRADDIGVPGKQFQQLMELFIRRRAFLALAVVPTWLTPPRWESLRQTAAPNPDLFCWHHHGWRHMNHETTGKKQEFGGARPPAALRKDLESGKNRLSSLMGNSFHPMFTPPWNRCSAPAMDALAQLGYRALSRSRNAKPPAPEGLPDIQVNVDLHTRKEADPALSMEKLLSELGAALSEGLCGIMIHHQLMNQRAFDFLGRLLSELSDNPRIEITSMAKLAEPGEIK